MKQAIIGLFVGVVVGALGVYLLECLEHKQAKEAAELSAQVPPSVFEVFRFTLEDEVNKKLGSPVEGFEPKLFMEVFPGLAATDFEGVAATTGTYEIENGELVFVPDTTRLQHSAAGAITQSGMATLLANVSTRTKIDLSASGTLTDIMHAISGV